MSSTAVQLAPARALVATRPTFEPRVLSFCAVATYALLVAAAVHHHEPWGDEAQAWLLARDASLTDLWLRLLHYEGAPGLWHTLLHFLVGIGLPYSAYNFVSAAFALSGVYLLIRYAPLPLAIRLLLPFTYYLCYQYSVVARSYSLLAPLLFATALIFRRAAQRPFVFTALLCLIAGISVHGVVLSACIWLTAYFPIALEWRQLKGAEQRRLAIGTLIYGLVVLVIVLCAWPAKDVAFAEHRGLSNFHFLPDVVKATLAGAFTGDWMTSVAVIVLSFPVLWRGGGWLFFFLTTTILCLFGTLVYAQIWHFGIFFMAWLFAIWISGQRTKITTPTLIAVAAVIACQCSWTAQSMYYDWKQPYSGSLQAAQYFHRTGVPSGGIYAIGFGSTAIQPYFSSNLFSSFNRGGHAAYWDWSKGNSVDDPIALVSSHRREFVLAGYKNDSEKSRWAKLLKLLGYEQIHHFEGSTFWQTRPFEAEAFDLYRRGSDRDAPQVVSKIDITDPVEAVQLTNGFYGVEMNAWRWTAKNFSVVLKPPPGSERNLPKLALQLYIPPIETKSLGPITLHADVDGYPLAERTFSSPGAFIYSAAVPPDLLRLPLVTVNFHLDKAMTNLKSDTRELGAVVSGVGFESQLNP